MDWSNRAKNTTSLTKRIKNATDFAGKTKNATSFIQRVRNFLVYFWGNQDDLYVVDHLSRKIVFSEDFSLVGMAKNATDYTNRTKN